MQTQHSTNRHNGGINPAVAAVAGAVVGAGIGVAGAIALKDEKRRHQVKAAFENVKNTAQDYADSLQDKAGDAKDKLLSQDDNKKSKK